MMTYYIQRHISGFLGNAPIWWCEGGIGYSAYLERAQRFSKEEAERIVGKPVGQKGKKYHAWPCEFIDSRIHKVFDEQEFGALEQWKSVQS